MISAVLRLRLKPCCAVEQKLQFKVQPTCDDTHKVPRSSSGMNTVSTLLPPSTLMSHLRVPSRDACSITTSGRRISALSCRRVHNTKQRKNKTKKKSTPR